MHDDISHRRAQKDQAERISGKVRGAYFSGKAGETLDRIFGPKARGSLRLRPGRRDARGRFTATSSGGPVAGDRGDRSVGPHSVGAAPE